MDVNYHYYVTYTAARKAGFPAADALTIARAARYVDECWDVTVQDWKRLFMENLKDSWSWKFDILLNAISIWIPFHFLPGGYTAVRESIAPAKKGLAYPQTHLICGPEGPLAERLIEAAKTAYAGEDRTKALLQIGIAMHTLADTFAHQGFAGIPCPEINEVYDVKHLIPHPSNSRDDILTKVSYGFLDHSYAPTKSSFGYLGHGRIGVCLDLASEILHYGSSWHGPQDPYITRCNPLEFCCAYLQMTQAMRYILGTEDTFQNWVERWTLLDQKGPLWGKIREILQVFFRSDTDGHLENAWRDYVDDDLWPESYRPLQEDTALEALFREAAEEQRGLVWDNCAPWRDYAQARGGKRPA